MTDDEIDYWTCEEDADRLMHATISEAVEDAVENYLYEDAEITVYGYRRRQITEADIYGSPLENVLEALDDEFAVDDATKPTEAMLEAERAFKAVIIREYKPQACERVTERVVRVADYINAERKT